MLSLLFSICINTEMGKNNITKRIITGIIIIHNGRFDSALLNLKN